MSTAPIDRILPLLPNAKQRQPGQWSASCSGPNHANGDRTPSLSVRETPDGAVLLHCFAGCTVHEIVAALGLEMTDLFPPREPTGREPKRPPRLLSAGQALELLRSEAMLTAIAAANLAHGVVLGQTDRDRLNQAAARINWLHEESSALGGHRHD
ncbi:MAG: hypothetical protein KA781_06035 [Aquabacterium sp.]|nr:hypothetical protein [Aquabacterium sp.]